MKLNETFNQNLDNILEKNKKLRLWLFQIILWSRN